MKHELDVGSWRLYCALPWVNKSYAEVVSQTMRMKLSEYERSLRHVVQLSKYITLPNEWKEFDKETDLFLSVLWQSVDRYIGYFRRFAGLLKKPTDSFVEYASSLQIKTLSFPTPQLIPNEPDDTKYPARICRAFLHMFSYPELTTCRCEMESERNTALLFYSFFDWFGTISYGKLKDGKPDSSRISIFKRFPIPTWTADGFAPIVFMSQPLQSRSKEKEFGHALVEGILRDCEVPMFLVPLLSAVQPALQALLLREITKWTQSRKTVKEQFSLPDWLFIHGILYDGTEIQLYTCTPRITECDTDGVPSKWHFACFPSAPYYFRPFRDWDTFKRLTAAVNLLKVQRHTKRICDELQDLKLDPVDLSVPLVSGKADISVDEEVTVLNNTEKLHVDIEQRQVQATESLLQGMGRAGLCPNLASPRACSSNEWTFLATPQDIARSQNFFTTFLQNWRPTSELLSLPEDWFKPAPGPLEDEEDIWDWRSFQTEAKSQLQVWLSRQKEKFIPISEKELHARHFNPDSFAPDFYLSVPARKHRHVDRDKLCMTDLSPQTMMHVPEHFKDIIQYAAYEIDAKFAMSSLFMCTPGCWLKCDTESRFPSALVTTPVSVDFSLLLHSIQTVPIDMTPLTPDVGLRATILNPALVVGIQGSTLWPSEFLHPSSHIRPKNKTEALVQLATAVEPSLKTHLINWQLRFEQGLTPSRDLPPWFMLFGIIYDAQEVNIVAHIPSLNASSKYSYKSCIVDTISFPLATPSSKVTEPWYMDRFRAGLALLSIQKHAFHMAQLWEGVAWPDELISWEEIIEREHLGPVLTPSERGYMTMPDPMWELYRELNGSDTSAASNGGGIDEEEDMDTGEDSLEDADEHDTAAGQGRVKIQVSGKDDSGDQVRWNRIKGVLDTTGSEHPEEHGVDTTMDDQCDDEDPTGMTQGQQSIRSEEKPDKQFWLPFDQNFQPSEGSDESDVTPVEERIEFWRLNVTACACAMDAVYTANCEDP